MTSRGAQLTDLIGPERVRLELAGADAAAVLGELAGLLCGRAQGAWTAEVASLLAARETISPTALPGGVAVPHCRSARVEKPRVAIGLCRSGVAFGAPDALPTRVFFAILAPESRPAAHLEVLASVARWLRGSGPEALLACTTVESVLAALGEGNLAA